MLYGFLHPLGLLVTDSDDFNILVFESHPQIVAHVQMVEVDSGHFPLAHYSNSSLLQR